MISSLLHNHLLKKHTQYHSHCDANRLIVTWSALHTHTEQRLERWDYVLGWISRINLNNDQWPRIALGYGIVLLNTSWECNYVVLIRGSFLSQDIPTHVKHWSSTTTLQQGFTMMKTSSIFFNVCELCGMLQLWASTIDTGREEWRGWCTFNLDSKVCAKASAKGGMWLPPTL